MEFAPFTVIAGINASGKSNLFDALTLLARMAENSIRDAFREQRGEPYELFTKYGEDVFADEMEFKVEMLVNKSITDAWGGKAELKYTRLNYEIKLQRQVSSSGLDEIVVVRESLTRMPHEDPWLARLAPRDREFWRPKVKTGKRAVPYMETEDLHDIPTVTVSQDGTGGIKRKFPLKNAGRSVLSSIDGIDFPHMLAAKEEMKSWRFLQLNPDDLRQPTSKKIGEDVLGPTGKNLAAVLHRIKSNDPYSLRSLSRRINSFLPTFVDVDVHDDSEGKQYMIILKDTNGKTYSSRVLSEGTLRILALCILEEDERHTGMLCFEEPENGIHPFRIKTIIKLLKDLTIDFSDHDQPIRQVVVNTHSPSLVAQAIGIGDKKNVKIYYAQMRRLIGSEDINGSTWPINLLVTKVVQVLNDRAQPLNLKMNDDDRITPDQKITLEEVRQYLHSEEVENALKILSK